MNDRCAPYGALVVVGRLTVSLLELGISDDDRVLRLRINGRNRGDLRLLRYCAPGIACDGSQITIWGGTRLYVLPVGHGEIRCFDLDEEIHAVYPLQRHWCVVLETGVAILDRATAEKVAAFDHREILLDSWWSGDRLVVEDLQGRQLRLRLLVGATVELKLELVDRPKNE